MTVSEPRQGSCRGWTPKGEPIRNHKYAFDRYRSGRLTAQGAIINDESNLEDARKAAARLFGNHPYESFVLKEVDGQPVNRAQECYRCAGGGCDECKNTGFSYTFCGFCGDKNVLLDQYGYCTRCVEGMRRTNGD